MKKIGLLCLAGMLFATVIGVRAAKRPTATPPSVAIGTTFSPQPASNPTTSSSYRPAPSLAFQQHVNDLQTQRMLLDLANQQARMQNETTMHIHNNTMELHRYQMETMNRAMQAWNPRP